MKNQDAAEAAQNEAEELGREDACVTPLEGPPDVWGAVKRALDQKELPPELVAEEEIRAQVWAQRRIGPLVATLGAMIAAHPHLEGLTPAKRGISVIGTKHSTAVALRKLVRDEIMDRVRALVRAALVQQLHDELSDESQAQAEKAR